MTIDNKAFTPKLTITQECQMIAGAYEIPFSQVRGYARIKNSEIEEDNTVPAIIYEPKDKEKVIETALGRVNLDAIRERLKLTGQLFCVAYLSHEGVIRCNSLIHVFGGNAQFLEFHPMRQDDVRNILPMGTVQEIHQWGNMGSLTHRAMSMHLLSQPNTLSMSCISGNLGIYVHYLPDLQTDSTSQGIFTIAQKEVLDMRAEL